jgi:hypothetical protein
MTLHVCDDLPGIRLVPAPIEIFGGEPELNDQIPGKLFKFDIASLFTPQAEQGRIIIAHDDPGVRAADEVATSL